MKKQNENITALEDVTLERATLAALLNTTNALGYMAILRTMLSDDDFTDEEASQTWLWAKVCAEKGQDVNPINIFAQAREAGKDWRPNHYIATGRGESDTLTLAYALHNLGVKRRLHSAMSDVVMSIEFDGSYTPEEAVGDVEQLLADTTKAVKPKVSTWRTVYGEIVRQTQRRASGELPFGTPCGFDLIDKKGGMERGELMIIAGRNSNGKTSFALSCAVGVASRGVAVGIFSLEMTNAQLGTRILSMTADVDGESIKRAEMTPEEWGRFTASDDRLPIYFDEVRSADIDIIIGNIKAMQAQYGVQVVVIDYLQLLRSKERERVQQVGSIAHRLEALSKQLEITILLLSQLRRNVEKDPTPRLEELKESGDIADAADSVYLVYRPERHGAEFRYPNMTQNWSDYSTKGTALLMCVKNRQGALGGEQMLGFDAATTKFYQKTDFDMADTLKQAAVDFEPIPF